MTNLTDHLKLCLITHITTQSFSKYLEFIEQTIHGGITMLQLREKSTDYHEVKKRALALHRLLHPYNIPLIINDFVDLAAEVNADGVHVGNSDMSVLQAREKLGPNKIIGLSIESLEDLERANKLPASYITASAIFPTPTKSNCKTFWGIDGLKQIVDNSVHPVTAIGGIQSHHVSDIFNTGAKGVAVISAIHDAQDPFQATRSLLI